MAKRSSEGETLKHIKQIGQLRFSKQDLIGTGSYGTSVFRGIFIDEFEGKPKTIAVAIKRIEEVNSANIEKVIMDKIELHANILRYYATEEDDDFM